MQRDAAAFSNYRMLFMIVTFRINKPAILRLVCRKSQTFGEPNAARPELGS